MTNVYVHKSRTTVKLKNDGDDGGGNHDKF